MQTKEDLGALSKLTGAVDMFNWVTTYQTSTPQTKFFILTWAVYGVAIAVTTAYCYGRLDYVRSYKAPPPENHEIINFKSKSP